MVKLGYIMEKKYFIVTYGCQMNVHESEKIAGILKEMGYSAAESENEADIIVFNTCCIRENAENHAFGNIGALKKRKRENPDLLICVGGCMMQEKDMPSVLRKKFPFVDVVFGTHNLYELPALIERRLSSKKRGVVSVLENEGGIVEGREPVRTSFPNAWVNINYGCNNFCTYCIVPYVRGRERSRRPEYILDEVKRLVEQGYKEITLLGQNVNSYGNDSGLMGFPELLDRVASVEGNFRLRFMTSHPKDFNEELVRIIAKHDKICNLIHLPVQSGSDRVLQRMNRRYTSGEYLEKVKMLRRIIPDAEITSDIIVGFPGETEEDFEETMRLVHEVNFASAFTFVYSKRKGTKAAEMPDQVPEEVQKERIMRLIELVNSQTREKSEKYVGKVVEILCEDFEAKKGYYLGRDVYGRMGYFKSEENKIGQFVKLKITEASGISLYGEEV